MVPETNIADDADEIGVVCAMTVFVRTIKQEKMTKVPSFSFSAMPATAPSDSQLLSL